MKKVLFFLAFSLPCPAVDWPDWRGPNRDGVSPEKGLPTTWSLAGQNLAWKAPYGGRSAPVVWGYHLYLQNSAGKGPTQQERVVCLNADTGKLIWEYRFNIFESDVPTHRVGWPSPAVDPETGNVYALGVHGTMMALTKDGKLIWERSMAEDFGITTTHGGRTVSPLIDGDLVIVSAVTFQWGAHAAGAHRFFAFDKKTGDCIWMSSPEGRPTDTIYPAGVIANIIGTRLLISGGSDGAVHALKSQTGEPVWHYNISKRGLNNGVILKGTDVIVSQSEENLDSNEMGLVASFDATAKGVIGPGQIRWSFKGFLAGFPSPVLDGDHFYLIDNGAQLSSFDVKTGKELWKKNLGTVQKASPVLADGKLYVGTESGKFYILKPGADSCEVLSVVQLGNPDAPPEQVLASVAISRGRVYMESTEALYAIGKKSNDTPTPAGIFRDTTPAGTTPAAMLVSPTEFAISPGESARFHARFYDAQGRFIREDKAIWSLEQLAGSIKDDGQFTASADNKLQSGLVKATAGTLSASARLRVVPKVPYSENFDAMPVGPASPAGWVNVTNKYDVREMDGSKVLVKLAIDRPFHDRSRTFFGSSHLDDYTVQADVRSTERRRSMGDAGVITQRYMLTLYGNDQVVRIESWQPEVERNVKVPYAWKPNTWYRLKLEVQNMPDRTARVRGKVWPASESEPSAWTIEKIDSLRNKEGAPGIYGNAALAEVYFDNIKVTSNKP